MFNEEYLSKLFESNKEDFIRNGIESASEIEGLLITYMTENFKIDFDIDLDTPKLFSKFSGQDFQKEA